MINLIRDQLVFNISAKDVNVLLGMDVMDISNGSIVLKELPGGYITESGMTVQPIQILVRCDNLLNAESLICEVHKAILLLSHCSVLMYPSVIVNDVKFCIMSASYLFYRI